MSLSARARAASLAPMRRAGSASFFTDSTFSERTTSTWQGELEVGVDATVGAVGAAALLDGAVHLNVVHGERIHVETLDLWRRSGEGEEVAQARREVDSSEKKKWRGGERDWSPYGKSRKP